MPETIEETIEATSRIPQLTFTVGSPGSLVIASLAAYGATKLTSDAVRLTKKFRSNREAKKAAEKAAEPATPQS